MRFKDHLRGSAIMEYAIPLALIALVVGLGLYYAFQNKSLFNNFVFTSAGKVDNEGGKLSFGTGSAVNGIYTETDGKVYLANSSGDSIRIPLPFYEEYKNDLQNYLNQGKFDFNNSSLAVETSGAAGIEDVSYSNKASTLLYSKMIEMVADKQDDPTTQELLKQMSTYGTQLGNLETDLISIKKEIDGQFKAFEAYAGVYKKAQSVYDAAKEAYDKDPSEENMMKKEKAYAALQDAYETYADTMESYKGVSTEYLEQATAYFSNLKDQTGVSFDQIVDQIEASDKIDATTKEFILPIANKISAIKDSVDLIEKLVNAFNADFNDIELAYTQFATSFTSFDIQIDEKAGDETFDLIDQQYITNQGSGKGKK